MAKRNNNDKLLMYSIIGIFSAIIILAIALIIVSNAENDEPGNEELYSYSQFPHLSNYDTLDDQSEDVYGVYFYSETCGACISIKEQVLEMAASNNSGLKIYLLDAGDYPDGDIDRIILNGEDLSHTPTMLVYRDGELVELYEGSAVILPFIDDVESGNYSN